MALRDFLPRISWGRSESAAAPANAVRASLDGGVLLGDLTGPEALAFFRDGHVTSSGAVVGIEGAMRVAAAYRCTHIIAGACGNLPIDVYRRISETERQPAADHPLRAVLQRPNSWQTSSEFRKMLTAHAVLKGNGYAIKITSRGKLLALWPLKNPDRMTVTQNSDMTLNYVWSRDNGGQVTLAQGDVLHLRGLTLDGIKGVGVIAHARQALGLSLQAEDAAARIFKNGVIAGMIFSKPGVLGQEAFDRLKQQIDENNAGAENAGKSLILEEDLTAAGSLMSPEDLQFLEVRKFERSDICMFFGVPPHMVGDTEKSTSWGSGIESQGIGFVTYTANDWFVMWEEALARDCLDPVADADVYVRLQRQALMRGDFKARLEALQIQRRNGVINANEWRGLEEMNPRTDAGGDEYIVEKNMGTAETPAPVDPASKDDPNAPAQPA